MTPPKSRTRTGPKPVTPYERLLKAARQYESEVAFPHSQVMWEYPAERLKEAWVLTGLAERVSAADQLGYDVLLNRVGHGDLRVTYRKRPGQLDV